MRVKTEMAMVVSDTECTTTKVWQPWYIDERDGVRKTLPTRALRDHRTKERLILHKPNNNKRAHSPSPSSDEEVDVGQHEIPLDHRAPPYSYSYAVDDAYDEDLPLDMSIKRRSPPLAPHTHTPPLQIHGHPITYRTKTPPPLQPPPAHTPATSPPPYSALSSRGRPSVITCAPPWLIPPPPYDIGSQVHEVIKGSTAPSSSVVMHNTLGDRRSPAAAPSRRTTAPESERGSPQIALSDEVDDRRRHVVQAGPIDPEIDEHFRRSLGKNYQALFVCENSNNQQSQSNDSVDDHFTKALGATWTKIKAQKEQESPLSPNVNRMSPAATGGMSPNSPSVTRLSTTSITSPRPGSALGRLFSSGFTASNGFPPQDTSSYNALLHHKSHLALAGRDGGIDKDINEVRSPSSNRILSVYQPVL